MTELQSNACFRSEERHLTRTSCDKLATATFLADKQVVIVGTKSNKEIQVKIVNESPLFSKGPSLKVDGKPKRKVVVFSLEPTEDMRRLW